MRRVLNHKIGVKTKKQSATKKEWVGIAMRALPASNSALRIHPDPRQLTPLAKTRKG
jgi:hypothetical protein